MEKYLINFHNGITEEIEVNNLEEARYETTKRMTYTQEKVTIETLDGEVLQTSYWYGTTATEDDDVLFFIGDFGFYSSWTDQ